MDICITDTLCYTLETNNVVNQLHSNENYLKTTTFDFEGA